MSERSFTPGEPVVFCMTKQSTCPGPRAHRIEPATKGDTYAYIVNKFWVVVKMLSDGRVVLRTRRGKEHIKSADDPNLRRASLWERLCYRDRFPSVEDAA